jgi:beta-N-acetylhexosaminidase
MLLAFEGKDAIPQPVLDAIRTIRPAGFTLFRALNIDHPAQVRALTQSLQSVALEFGMPPLLIAADQEGGQLMAVGDGATPLPGNMALGAARSPELAFRAGEVLGLELGAMGINLNYAPCCDVNINPRNPSVGTRSFGESPALVAELSAAMVSGMQSQGIASTAKHFPGHGDTTTDSHHGIAVLPHSLERLREVEFPPFIASIAAGVRAVMVGHLALPAIEGGSSLPATLSPTILNNLLRGELGFGGVIVSDAMNMRAIRQGEYFGEQIVQAVRAGIDLLLMGADLGGQRRAFTALVAAVRDQRLDLNELSASSGRVHGLRDWIRSGADQPDLDVVGCPDHLALAEEIAARSITLVRDDNQLLPLRLPAGGRLAVIVPRPRDLTPADTSSYETPALAQAMRHYHPDVDEFLVPHEPDESDIAALLGEINKYERVIIGTLNALTQPSQAALVQAILQSGAQTVVVALRMPSDLNAFPQAPAYVCTYSILEPSMQAVAKALWGRAAFPGWLPASIPNLYPAGYRLELS